MGSHQKRKEKWKQLSFMNWNYWNEITEWKEDRRKQRGQLSDLCNGQKPKEVHLRAGVKTSKERILEWLWDHQRVPVIWHDDISKNWKHRYFWSCSKEKTKKKKNDKVYLLANVSQGQRPILYSHVHLATKTQQASTPWAIPKSLACPFTQAIN